ncbi:serine hydrolase domain-containing protein [Allobranchiibius sp. GilTou38]|uniref:serine hydrolase domain-containing protein n=1 Tax=Allobranchiibius sp. GilTou38 TaxID=2815210 RepID=UPI001AA158F3|nr:serine hydrolase domain-containing protein [Allobranchiibius sp. GilTou38]MBO1766755.1 beta-lactamase family protein [Allobranchiibius sp. GilTou38]
MTKLDEVKAWLDTRLPELIETYDVPAAAVAVSAGEETVEAAAGVLSLSTGVTATTDSVFQIGSITKMWTATMVMQLVEQGRVDLESPVRRYLPDFSVADAAATSAMTVRQLLSHTAGFEGDIFTDTGPGDDALEKYVATLGDVEQLFPPGERFSYNNAGYCVLGRLLEVVHGTTYDECLRSHLFAPLGLTHSATSAAEAILFRAAVGHVRPEPDAEQQPAPIWNMARSNAPAGSILSMRAGDLIAFARVHLNSGRAANGAQVLRQDTVAQMQQRQVELPRLRVMGDAWGLGWEIYDTPAGPVIGHDGTTIGQASFLRMVPADDVAVVLLTNGGEAYPLYLEVVGHLLAELSGTRLPPLPAPPHDPPRIDASRYTGIYASRVADLVIEQDDDGRIWREIRPKGEFADMGESPTRVELVAYEDDMLIDKDGQQGLHMPHAFIGSGDAPADYVHIGRVVPRAHGH